MKNLKIDTQLRFFPEELIQKVEIKHRAKYVCETSYKNVYVALFYSEVEHEVSKSHYFIMFDSQGIRQPDSDYWSYSYRLASGEEVSKQQFQGVVVNEVVYYSVHRHDYRELPNDVLIDGGRDYLRTNSKDVLTLEIRNGELQIIGGQCDNKV